MGENADIKHYDFRPADGSSTLFPTSASRAGIVARLLEARWLARASSLPDGDVALGRSALGKRRDQPVAVRWDERTRAPVMFTRGRRRYVVDEVLARWVAESYWWDPARRLSRSYWRIRCGDGVYDLCFDRVAERWLLAALMD